MSTPLFPWNEAFSWTELAELAGYALLLGLVAGALVALVVYLLIRGQGNRPVAQGQQRPQDPAVMRALVAGGVVALAVILLVPVMYRQGDRVANNGNVSTTASASSQQIESLEDEIGQQMTARVEGMGYRVIDNDVENSTVTVEFGTCRPTISLSEVEPAFVIGEAPNVVHMRAGHPYTMRADISANPNHPLADCVPAA